VVSAAFSTAAAAFGVGFGFSSEDEEDDEAPPAPLHFFRASIHFLRSSEVAVAIKRCWSFLSPLSFIQNLCFLSSESPSSIFIPVKGMTFDLPSFFLA
jgi:hypothetical protein